MNLKKEWLYWTCQIAGWGSYSLLVFALGRTFAGWQSDIALGFLLFFLYSIGLTHLFRAYIRHRKWLLLPAAAGLPRVFGGAIAVGVFQTFLVIAISGIRQGRNSFDTTAITSTAAGIVFMTCSWTAIYVGVFWYRRYRQTQLREMQIQLALRQAELRALQAQVNPHFLFNSLNAIRGTVSENPEQARDMITRLANLFRRSLRSDAEPMVPLRDEIAAVSDYLALESVRFEERLNIRVDVTPEAEQCDVPAMLVQTLVENAVRHGISQLPDGGVLCIRGSVESDSLVIEVQNTGRLQSPNGDGTHTGLSNAQQRLRLLCGSEARLELTEKDDTVAARIVIPQVS
jgi:two-component system sensor histidine kinase AlgZ